MNKKVKVKFNILAIICILIFCFSITPKTFQNDTYYTIAIGKHIVETKQVDMLDPFSWHEDLPYTYPHWAYDVCTYGVYQLGESIGIGGFCAIYISTVLLCMTLGLVIYYTLNKLCKNNIVSLIITIASMYLLKNFIAARAQLATFILFALTILFIEQFIATKKKRYAAYLIIIPILIANLHCAVWPFYFVLYLPYIAEYLIATIIDAEPSYWFAIKWNNRKIKKLNKKGKIEEVGIYQEKIAKLQLQKENAIQNRKKRQKKSYKVILKKEPMIKWLIVVMIICTFTGFLTPLGTTPYTYLIKTLEGTTTSNISEHLPLTLINNKQMLIVFTMFLLILIFTDTKTTLRDFFMLGGLTLLTFMSRRQASIFVIICGFIFAKLVAKFIDKYDKKSSLVVMEFMTTLLGKTLTVIIVILLSFIMYKGKIDDEFVSKSSYPVEASEYILNNLNIDEIHLFNEYNYGSYLLYKGIPVFIDSRADLYAPEFNATKTEEGRDIFSDYINTSNLSSYYETKFEKYDITHVILGKKSKLNMLISKNDDYVEIYSDEYFAIYNRLGDQN